MFSFGLSEPSVGDVEVVRVQVMHSTTWVGDRGVKHSSRNRLFVMKVGAQGETNIGSQGDHTSSGFVVSRGANDIVRTVVAYLLRVRVICSMVMYFL